ncbi:MAG TPA: hypothetical protein VJQ47_13395 [Steroidobacteraceae bacterium]|nr:hypothetical protein [Steroidobacteraceae bacterium]
MNDPGPFGPKDDEFHAEQMSDRWWETETSWYSFCVPERRLGGWLYTLVRPNIGTVAGGAWVWDDSAHLPWEVLYCANYSAQRLRVGTDLRDCVLPNGVGIRVREPLTRYDLTYTDADRIDLRLTFDAVMPPRRLSSKHSAFGSANHFDQIGRVTGRVVLHGAEIGVDCLAMRDRSWGPRPEHRPRQSAYVTGIASAEHSFLAVTSSDGRNETITYGFLTRDGVTHDLVAGARKVRRDPANGWAAEIEITAVDEMGRKLCARGRRLSGMIINRHTFIDSNGLFEWDIDGHTGHGEDQDLWIVHRWAQMRRRSRNAGAA